MRTFAQQQTQPPKQLSSRFARSNTATPELNHQTHPITHWQRAIANQALQRILQTDAQQLNAESSATASPRVWRDFSQIPIHPPTTGAIQTKLAIDKPGEIYEQEADHVAEQVMSMSAPQLQCACACGGECPQCQTEQPGQEHERLQPKRVRPGVSGQTAVPPIVHEVLSSPGQPLDPATRAFMESRFGHDFSQVRVHTDAKAAESARAVNALAYTVGRDVVFRAGQYAPGRTTGRGVLAHELAHVVQQRGSAPALARLRLGSSDTAEEHEAHSAAVHIAQGKPAKIGFKAAPGLVQRQLCGGQQLPPCPTTYISIPSDSGIGNAVGEWIGLQYRERVARPINSYLLVDHRLYYRGQRLSQADLSQRTSRTGTPRPGLDPDVYTALQESEFFEVLRPDILDSDRDHLYEIKPVRGAGAGPAQLNGYILRLREFAAAAPDWMGGRARNWQVGPWRPRLQFSVSGGSQPVIVCIYPDAVQGVLLYDILSCRPRSRRESPVQEPARQRASAQIPLTEPARQRARVRVISNHPYFEDLANRLPYMEAPPGRDFIVVIEDGIFRQVKTEAERRYMEQQRRLLRPDPRGMPIIQLGALIVVWPRILAITAIAAAAVATAAVALPALLPEAAVATTATTATASTITVPATIAARVAPAVTAAATAAPAIPAAAITAPAATWGTAKLVSTAAIVATLTAGGMSKAQADTVAEDMKPLIGKRILAMADVTMTKAELANAKPGQDPRGQAFRNHLLTMKTFLIATGWSEAEAEAEALEQLKTIYTTAEMTTTKAELANAKPGQEVSIDGQTFRVIIRLKAAE